VKRRQRLKGKRKIFDSTTKFPPTQHSLLYRERILSRVQAVLNETKNPRHLLYFAKMFLTRGHTKLVRQFGEKAQDIILKVQKLRTEFAPIKKEYEALKSTDTKGKLKESFEKIEKLKYISFLLSLIPSFLTSFSNRSLLMKLGTFPDFAKILNVKEFDEVSLDLITLMTASLVHERKDFENKLQDLPPEKRTTPQVAATRKELEEKISALVNSCLGNRRIIGFSFFLNPFVFRQFQ